jgi:hypothetical protein
MWTFPNLLVLSFHVALDVKGRVSSLWGFLNFLLCHEPIGESGETYITLFRKIILNA